MNNEAQGALAASHRQRRDMRGEEGLVWHQWETSGDMQKVKVETWISQNDRKWETQSQSETAAPLLGFALLLTGTGGGTCNCTWKRIHRKRGDESLFMHLPEDLTLPHSSDSRGGEISRAAVQNQGDSPPSLTSSSSPNLDCVPHRICASGEHQRVGTQGLKLFSSNFIYTYLFIYTQFPVPIHNTFRKRPNMLMHVCMLQTFEILKSKWMGSGGLNGWFCERNVCPFRMGLEQNGGTEFSEAQNQVERTIGKMVSSLL